MPFYQPPQPFFGSLAGGLSMKVESSSNSQLICICTYSQHFRAEQNDWRALYLQIYEYDYDMAKGIGEPTA